MEVQAHGNYYEDLKTRQITGLGKAEYDALKENGYTSGMDIMKGLMSANDYSIKTTNGNRICLLYTSPSPRDRLKSRMPSSA